MAALVDGIISNVRWQHHEMVISAEQMKLKENGWMAKVDPDRSNRTFFLKVAGVKGLQCLVFGSIADMMGPGSKIHGYCFGMYMICM